MNIITIIIGLLSILPKLVSVWSSLGPLLADPVVKAFFQGLLDFASGKASLAQLLAQLMAISSDPVFLQVLAEIEGMIAGKTSLTQADVLALANKLNARAATMA